jgi:hypothetical protein
MGRFVLRDVIHNYSYCNLIEIFIPVIVKVAVLGIWPQFLSWDFKIAQSPACDTSSRKRNASRAGTAAKKNRRKKLKEEEDNN